MPSASDVLPWPGRAATIVSVDGCMPEQHRVEVVVSGGGADDVALAVVQRVQLVHRLFERGPQLHDRVGDAPFGDLEDRRFGAVERLVDRVLGRVRHLLDAARGLDQPPQHRELGDDLRVVRGVRRRGRRGLDPQQGAAAAELFELTRAPQLLGDGHRVDRFAPGVQAVRGLEDRAVRGLVEVAGLEPGLDRGGDRLPAEHHRAEERLLGLEVVRRDARAVRTSPRVLDRDHRRYLLPRRGRDLGTQWLWGRRGQACELRGPRGGYPAIHNLVDNGTGVRHQRGRAAERRRRTGIVAGRRVTRT